MKITPTPFDGLYVIEPTVFHDQRGFFYESFHEEKLAKVIGDVPNFVQDNQSRSSKYVLRGMHLQKPPYEQVKLVRAIQGEVLDVVIDVRQSSKTFGQHYKILLSAENKKQLYIPTGFAHGILTLSDTMEFAYKCSNFYHPDSETGLAFDDPEINIDWGMDHDKFIVSEKDLVLRENTLQSLQIS